MSTTGVELDGMGSLRRSHRCGEVMSSRVGDEVVLAGWVHRRRDHGGVIFVDLRDKTGLVQIVFRPESAPRGPCARACAAFGMGADGARRDRAAQ